MWRPSASHRTSSDPTYPRRILMLVPHEPDADPRVRWVMQLCEDIGPTEVIGMSGRSAAGPARTKPAREAAGNVYVERIDLYEYASMRKKLWSMLTSFLSVGGCIRRYLERERQGPEQAVGFSATSGPDGRSWRHRADHQLGAGCRFLMVWAAYDMIIDALYRRARTSCILPRVIVCHDVFALAAGIRLKQRFGCAVLYDAHELWPEADLLAQPWERRAMALYEGQLVRQADAVVTVTPQIAAHLEERYHISNVICAPNATPSADARPFEPPQPRSLPIKCLFQGQVTWRRGLEELLGAWKGVAADQAVLYLRCPENEYLSYLKEKFAEMVRVGTVVFLPPVGEDQLVEAAREADVGVIPYVGPNLNHEYCCPNKLSQYMQAGLAILSNRLAFVTDVITRYQCGLTYKADEPASLVQAIRHMAEHPTDLLAMRRRAAAAAHKDFNWTRQSAAYKQAIASLFAG